jgi:hypothetical protein
MIIKRNINAANCLHSIFNNHSTAQDQAMCKILNKINDFIRWQNLKPIISVLE